MDLFYILDLLGTFAFAISGVLAALNKKLDIFGVIIISMVTACGGGTIRDILIGKIPVGWMIDINIIYTVLVGVLFTLFFKKTMHRLRKTLFLFDTIGLGLCTIIGVSKGLALDLHPLICIFLGTMTGSFGGVIRDILCNEVPVIFRKEIYATACVVGGFFYILLNNFGITQEYISITTVLIVICIRIIVVKYELSLPSLYKKN